MIHSNRFLPYINVLSSARSSSARIRTRISKFNMLILALNLVVHALNTMYYKPLSLNLFSNDTNSSIYFISFHEVTAGTTLVHHTLRYLFTCVRHMYLNNVRQFVRTSCVGFENLHDRTRYLMLFKLYQQWNYMMYFLPTLLQCITI